MKFATQYSIYRHTILQRNQNWHISFEYINRNLANYPRRVRRPISIGQQTIDGPSDKTTLTLSRLVLLLRYQEIRSPVRELIIG